VKITITVEQTVDSGFKITITRGLFSNQTMVAETKETMVNKISKYLKELGWVT
jgi:hypothetical protein